MNDSICYKSLLEAFCKMHHLKMVFTSCLRNKHDEDDPVWKDACALKKLVLLDQDVFISSKNLDDSTLFIFGVDLVVPEIPFAVSESSVLHVKGVVGRSEEECCKKFIDNVVKADFFSVNRPSKIYEEEVDLKSIESLELLAMILDLNVKEEDHE